MAFKGHPPEGVFVNKKNTRTRQKSLGLVLGLTRRGRLYGPGGAAAAGFALG